jgi:hypothetical protein
MENTEDTEKKDGPQPSLISSRASIPSAYS